MRTYRSPQFWAGKAIGLSEMDILNCCEPPMEPGQFTDWNVGLWFDLV
jgi:hypothetical protein